MGRRSDAESLDDEKKYNGCNDCTLGCDCCFWKSSCHLCCGFLPSINRKCTIYYFWYDNIFSESTGTKIMYSLYLLFFTAFATLINSAQFTSWLTQMEVWNSFCCAIDQSSNENCTFSEESDTIGMVKTRPSVDKIFLIYQ